MGRLSSVAGESRAVYARPPTAETLAQEKPEASEVVKSPPLTPRLPLLSHPAPIGHIPAPADCLRLRRRGESRLTRAGLAGVCSTGSVCSGWSAVWTCCWARYLARQER